MLGLLFADLVKKEEKIILFTVKHPASMQAEHFTKFSHLAYINITRALAPLFQ